MSNVRVNARNVLAEVQRVASGNFQEFAESMLGAAKEHPERGGAPVDTGNLSSSLAKEMRSDGVGFRLKTATAQDTSTGKGYGYYVHEGTGRRAPDPFFVRAYDATRKDFEDAWQ